MLLMGFRGVELNQASLSEFGVKRVRVESGLVCADLGALTTKD